jgi:hypothetical protein
MCPGRFANADGKFLANERFFAYLLYVMVFPSQHCEWSASAFALAQENPRSETGYALAQPVRLSIMR